VFQGQKRKQKFLENAIKGTAYGTCIIIQLRRLYRPLQITVTVEMSKRSFDTVFSNCYGHPFFPVQQVAVASLIMRPGGTNQVISIKAKLANPLLEGCRPCRCTYLSTLSSPKHETRFRHSSGLALYMSLSLFKMPLGAARCGFGVTGATWSW